MDQAAALPDKAPDGAPVEAGTLKNGNPGFLGKPNSWQVGTTKDRKYDAKGYPEKDVDWDSTDHGQGRPHVHEWDKPADGSAPKDADRRPATRKPRDDETFSGKLRDPDTGKLKDQDQSAAGSTAGDTTKVEPSE